MDDTLFNVACRYARSYAGPGGVAPTPIPGLTIIRTSRPGGLDYAISRPLACLVLQGSKRVTTGTGTFDFTAGNSLLIAGDVPTVSQITRASADEPYLSLVLDLDLKTIAELAVAMKQGPEMQGATVKIEPTDAEVANSALRLMRLLEKPSALPVLQTQLVREMHYWLLAGNHGTAIRQLGWPDSHTQRVSRAVSLLRAEFAQKLSVERLAESVGMSPSSFYQHFRAATSLSPLQFQKQLRLIEARRLMLTEDVSASSAAFSVGYESVQQFTREYRRMFGLPPGKDAEAIRNLSSSTAAIV